jgi:hypothetical protein
MQSYVIRLLQVRQCVYCIVWTASLLNIQINFRLLKVKIKMLLFRNCVSQYVARNSYNLGVDSFKGHTAVHKST